MGRINWGALRCWWRGRHDPEFMGGANAGCSPVCACSVPVYECKTCGACDYGINAEANDIRRKCAEETGRCLHDVRRS